jgi:hypothetical protein
VPCPGDGPGDTLHKRTNESLSTRTACGGLLMRMWAARHASKRCSIPVCGSVGGGLRRLATRGY